MAPTAKAGAEAAAAGQAGTPDGRAGQGAETPKRTAVPRDEAAPEHDASMEVSSGWLTAPATPARSSVLRTALGGHAEEQTW